MNTTTKTAKPSVAEVEAQNNESLMVFKTEYEPDEAFWKETMGYATAEFAKSIGRESLIKVMIAANLYAKSNIIDFEDHMDAVYCDMLSFMEGA